MGENKYLECSLADISCEMIMSKELRILSNLRLGMISSGSVACRGLYLPEKIR